MMRSARSRAVAIAERHDQGAAQILPARDEQDQGGDEQQEFSEGRRQELKRRLHPLDFRDLDRRRQRIGGAAQHALQFVPERERPVEHVHLVLEAGTKLGELVAPLHQRRGNQADHEGDAGAGRGHDQDRRRRTRNPVSPEQARRRRQHGADDERHGDGKKERLCSIKHANDTDQQQRHQRERHHLRPADHRRLFGLAVGHGRALRAHWEADVHWEGHARWFSPARGGDDTTAATARTELEPTKPPTAKGSIAES